MIKRVINLGNDTRVLVTGGTGFIGSQLAEKLASMGCIVDILSEENGDIRDKKLNLDNYDIIYHLAAISKPKVCEDNPLLAWDVNVNGTMNILMKLREDQKLVFASSARVYGTGRHPHREDEPLNPEEFYGLTKKVCEDLIAYYSNKNGFSFTVLRFYNIYGPGQSKGFLLPDVIEKYKSGRKVEIYNPEAVRDFLNIEDAVRALVAAAEVEGIFNIAYGAPTKIRDIYRMIKEELGCKSRDEKVIDRCRDALTGDISKARRVLGWKPRISLNEGIRDMIKFYINAG